MGTQPNKKHRPVGWRFVQLVCVVIVVRGVGRTWVALDAIEQFRALTYSPPLALYTAYNMWWSVVFASVLVLLWQRRLRPDYLIGVVFLLALSDTLWTLAFVPENYERARLPFNLLLWLLLLCALYLITRRDAFLRFAIKE